MLKLILQQYNDDTWGYRGYDDQGKTVINAQMEDEFREDFLKRINAEPNNNEYGSNENYDRCIIEKDYSKPISMKYALEKIGYEILNNMSEVRYSVLSSFLETIITIDSASINNLKRKFLDKGEMLCVFVDDVSTEIREELAKHAVEVTDVFILQQLKNDKNPSIRQMVEKVLNFDKYIWYISLSANDSFKGGDIDYDTSCVAIDKVLYDELQSKGIQFSNEVVLKSDVDYYFDLYNENVIDYFDNGEGGNTYKGTAPKFADIIVEYDFDAPSKFIPSKYKIFRVKEIITTDIKYLNDKVSSFNNESSTIAQIKDIAREYGYKVIQLMSSTNNNAH